MIDLKSMSVEGKHTTTDELASVMDRIYSSNFCADFICMRYLGSDVAELASIFNTPNLPAAKAASISDQTDLPADWVASIFNHANLTIEKATSILESPNIAITKINDIIIHDNIRDAKAGVIVANTNKATRDLTGAANISAYKFLDDFEDNLLSGRDRKKIPTTWLLSANNFAQLPSPEAFRPEWSIVEGTNVVINGAYEGDASGANKIATPSSIAEGAWEMTNEIISTGFNQTVYIMYQDSDNHYLFGNATPAGDRAWNLRKVSGGTATDLIKSIWTEEAGTYVMKITRDSSGKFEIFINGVSKGTTTDTWLPTISKIHLKNDDDGKARLDDIKVY